MALSPGQKVGDYEVIQTLGVGGLGAVYKAQHRISRRFEALKVALSGRMENTELTERFEREIQVLAGLNHPNIAGLHHAFYHGDELIMVMELVEGEDLRVRSRRAPIELPTLLRFASQVLAALDYAHAAGVVHRDIKPANIMVTPEGRIKVLDFGIATTSLSTHLTATGAMIGSISYMSPEQIQGSRATAQSDLYSLGITLYELIAGQLPFTGESSFDLMNAHLQQAPRSFAELRPQIPAALSLAIQKALAKQPRDRFRSAQEFMLALEGSEAATAAVSPVIVSAMPAAATQGSTSRNAGRISSSTEPLPEALEQVRRHLAQFIGPIAKVVVRRLAPTCGDLEQLYREAAKEIATDSDRQKFLRLRTGAR
ncbi:MAG TPA: serine/threonine-protein kinase [Acidobacteriaceae bacterium]